MLKHTWQFVEVRSRGRCPFRILIEIVGNTVHLIRRENSPDETIPGVRGFGHSFPEAYTTWVTEIRMSRSHQMVVGYCLGGLNIMGRFEGDGYIQTKGESDADASVKHQGGDLVDTLGDLNVNPTPIQPRVKAKLANITGGKSIAQKNIFDMKTRSIRQIDRDILSEELPRLWIRQIENFILAFHERGLFKDIRVQNVRDKFGIWEKEHQALLERLMALLHCIMKKARQRGRFEIVFAGVGSLEVRQTLSDAGEPLSRGVKQRWAGWLRDGDEAGEAGNGGIELDDERDESERLSDLRSDSTRFLRVRVMISRPVMGNVGIAGSAWIDSVSTSPSCGVVVKLGGGGMRRSGKCGDKGQA